MVGMVEIYSHISYRLRKVVAMMFCCGIANLRCRFQDLGSQIGWISGRKRRVCDLRCRSWNFERLIKHHVVAIRSSSLFREYE